MTSLLTLQDAYTYYHDSLLIHAHRLCGKDAEDMEQQVWVRACANWKNLQQNNVWGWLYTILTHLVIDWRRKPHNRDVYFFDDFQPPVEGFEQQIDEILSLKSILPKLSLRDRKVLGSILQYKNRNQAADVLGMSVSAYRLALMRARRRLAKAIACDMHN